MTWFQVDEGHVGAYEIFRRHYTYQPPTERRNKRRQILGPGQKMLLVTPDLKALFGWRKFIDDCVDERTGEKQAGVNCAVFRNEGAKLSSELILEAARVARLRWPLERLYTYVDPLKVLSGKRPGCCFYFAGWSFAGRTKRGLHVLEILPATAAIERRITH